MAPLPPSSPLPSLSLTVPPTNSLHWHLWGSHSPASLPYVCWRLSVVLPPVVHRHIHLRLLPHIRLPSHLSHLVGCCISQRLSLSITSCLHPAPWPPQFIMPPPFAAPFLFGWLLRCPAPHPPSCCDASCFLFVTALGIIRRCSCSRIHPVQCLLPKSRSRASPNIAVSLVDAVYVRCQHEAPPPLPQLQLAHVRCQRGVSAAIAVAVRPSPGRVPKEGVSPSGWCAQGVSTRRE